MTGAGRRGPETAYDDLEYEKVGKRKLLLYTWHMYVDKDERGAFGRLVDELMPAISRVGEVFRTGPDDHDSDCLLWCETNDTDERRKAATLRLWYPEEEAGMVAVGGGG